MNDKVKVLLTVLIVIAIGVLAVFLVKAPGVTDPAGGNPTSTEESIDL